MNRTGFGVEVGADGGLSGVFQLSADQISGLTSGLGGGSQGGGQDGDDQDGGGQGGGDQGGGQGGDDQGGDPGSVLGGNTDMGDLSGENKALAGENVMFTGGLDNINDNMDDVSTKGAQDALNASGLTLSGLDGTTKIAELETVTSPASHYSFSGIFIQSQSSGYPSANMGTLTCSLDIDFINKTIGGGNSYLNLDTTGAGGNISTGDLIISSLDYSETTSHAIFALETGNSSVFAIATLSNSGGVIAQQATISVSYDDMSAGDFGVGVVVTDARVEGITAGPA